MTGFSGDYRMGRRSLDRRVFLTELTKLTEIF
jgi:hypothetical protein